MKIKNIMKLLLVAVVISTTGCQKYLDLDPLVMLTENKSGERRKVTASCLPEHTVYSAGSCCRNVLSIFTETCLHRPY